MSGARGFDLDGETSRAWSAFTRRLADRLADLSDGETLTLGLGATSDDERARDGPRALRRSSRTGCSVVPSSPPMTRSPASSVTRQRDADQLATETVGLLKDSHGVMHPAFLTRRR